MNRIQYQYQYYSMAVLFLQCLVVPATFNPASAEEQAPRTYPMQALAPTVATILNVPVPKQAEAPPIEAIVNDLQGSKKVAVLGIDAFGDAIWAQTRDQTPYLNGLAQPNNRARLRSVLPSVTCVNFACMITGGSQTTTGIETFDSKLACEDLFSVLRAQGLKSGGFGIKDWTGDRLLGRYADLSVRDKANDEEVLAGLMEIVEEEKPEFIIVQYGETDAVFHRHGPSSDEARAACGRADAWLARVVPWLRSRGYAIIITADHGQHDVQNESGETSGQHGSDSDIDCLVPLVWLRSGD